MSENFQWPDWYVPCVDPKEQEKYRVTISPDACEYWPYIIAQEIYPGEIAPENFAEAEAIAPLNDIDNRDRWVEADREPVDVEALDRAIGEADYLED